MHPSCSGAAARADLLAQLRDLLVVRRDRLDHGDVDSGGSAMPGLAPNQGFNSVVPSGAKSGRVAFSRITAARASGMWAMLVTTAPLAEKTGAPG
jgi:hypothetical protein